MEAGEASLVVVGVVRLVVVEVAGLMGALVAVVWLINVDLVILCEG